MSKIREIGDFLKSKRLWLNIAGIIVVIFALVLLVGAWLKSYTNHGQQLGLPDFTGMHLDKAREVAEVQHFQIIASDSIHIIGQPGGEILAQNPHPNALVKENRKVYVTISKHSPELVDAQSLPELYGKNFERKRKELKLGYALESRIVGEQYDKGPEGHILAVIYREDTIINRNRNAPKMAIPKGSSLDFIVSTRSGGEVTLPDLRCLTWEEARFLLDSYQLSVGAAEADATVEDFDKAYVVRQEPVYEPNAKIGRGSSVNLFLSAEKPLDCP